MKNYFGDSGRYDDIIDLPHHVSPTRPRMPARDRAAQFAPFAALTGYRRETGAGRRADRDPEQDGEDPCGEDPGTAGDNGCLFLPG